ncbi:hypothetical protein B0I35DRAFT_196817 [Stachybotrys elegans]|uniref:Uncharacterized protein n=1 Tax=Stachybotrys elegans TaxID=80388 RepID=A0A8K0SCU8_9HYPO|nr:hypothetical protein B0I35DRAFT_196817 [Stachybotrys elegans]
MGTGGLCHDNQSPAGLSAISPQPGRVRQNIVAPARVSEAWRFIGLLASVLEEAIVALRRFLMQLDGRSSGTAPKPTSVI